MIEILGNEIEVSGLGNDIDFDPTKSTNFQVLLREEIGLTLPIISVSFGSPVVDINHTIGNDRVFTFRINDRVYNFRTAKVNNSSEGYKIQGILDNQNFMTSTKQMAEEGSVVDVLSKFEYVTLESNGVITNDQQIWLNPNKSERSFAFDLLSHSYISDDDFVLFMINEENSLILNSYKQVINSSPTWDFGTTVRSKYRLEEVNFETIPIGEYQFLFNKTGIETAPGFNNNYNSDYKSNKSSMVMIDAGNCYDKYYASSIQNMQSYAKLFEKLFNTRIVGYLGIKPMDTVIIRQVGNNQDDPDSDLISEPMLISRVDTLISQGSISQRFFFSRINDSE